MKYHLDAMQKMDCKCLRILGVEETETGGCIQDNFWKQDLWKFLTVVKEKTESKMTAGFWLKQLSDGANYQSMKDRNRVFTPLHPLIFLNYNFKIEI